MRFVRNHQVKIRGRKQIPVLVVEQQRLHGSDHDFGAPPVIPPFLVNHGGEVIGEQIAKHLVRLVFQLQPVHQKQNPARVARAQKQLDDGGGYQRLAGAGSHFKQEAVIAGLDGPLQGVDGAQLVVAQETQPALPDEAGAFRGVAPAGLRGIIGVLRQCDIVVVNPFVHQPLRVGRNPPVLAYRVGRRKRGDDVRVAALQIPEVMQVAVG